MEGPKRFFENSEYLKDSLIKGYLLSLFQVLVFPLAILQGYNIRIIRQVENGSNELPRMQNFWELFVDGCKISFVWSVYLIPFAATSFFLYLHTSQYIFAGGTLILTLIYLWIVPSIAREYAMYGIKQSFNILKIVKQSFTPSYVRNALKIKFVILIANIAGVLVSVTIVGLILLPLINFVGYATLGYFTGKAFEEKN